MRRSVSDFMRREGITPRGPVVVGLSGGADSVALLALLTEMGHECIAVHCHFGLRDGEADRDMDHSRNIAASLGARFIPTKFDTRSVMAGRGISAEMACRDLRYEFFEKVRVETGADCIAVAHHRDDNIETLFLNLIRGSGIHGLRAMLPRNGHVIRPLLEQSRDDILRYLAERRIDYVTDSTNASSDFARNRLRNEVLPTLYRCFPQAADTMTRTLTNLRGNEALYNSLLPASATLAEIKQSAAPATLIHELMSGFGFNATQTEAMLTAESGSAFTSPTHRAEIDRGSLTVAPLTETHSIARPKLQWREITPDEFHPVARHLYLDSSALDGNPEWSLRQPRNGDRMRPFGMKGTRLLSDIFASAKLSAAQKRNQWVLTRNGEIVWIVGLRASALFPVTESSTKIIEIHEKDQP